MFRFQKYIDYSLYRYYTIGMTNLETSLTALSNPTRRAIVARLSRGEATVNELVAQFELSQPTITVHLNVLEKAELITRGRVGQTRPCALNPKGLRVIAEWLRDYEHFWEGAVDRFTAHVEEIAKQEKQNDQNAKA